MFDGPKRRTPKALNANRICRMCFQKHVVKADSVVVMEDEIRAMTVCPKGCTQAVELVITINKPQYAE